MPEEKTVLLKTCFFLLNLISNLILLLSNSAACHSSWSQSDNSNPTRTSKYIEEFCCIVFTVSYCNHQRVKHQVTGCCFMQQSRLFPTCSGWSMIAKKRHCAHFKRTKLQLKNICTKTAASPLPSGCSVGRCCRNSKFSGRNYTTR